MTEPSDSTDTPTVNPRSQSDASTRDAPAPLLSEWMLSFAERHRFKLFLAIFGLLLLGFNAQWRVEADSALYLSVGRNLAEGRGFTFNGDPHRLAFPGPPLLFAGIFRIFHADPVGRALAAALVMMLLIGVAVLGLTYRLFLLYADRATAVMMTFGLGISRLFYKHCFELLSDMPFLLGLMAFLVGHEAIFHRSRHRSARGQPPSPARWFDYVLLVGGLTTAIVMRPTMWALLTAIVLALGWSLIRNPIRLQEILICLAVAAVAAGVLYWRLANHTGDSSMGQYEESLFHIEFTHIRTMFHNLVFENVPRFFNATLSQALFGARLGPVTSELVGVAVLLVSATMLHDRPLWFLWVAMTYVMMLVAIKPLDRYFLECLPLLVFAWWRGLTWLNHRLPQPWADWCFIALFLFGGITNLCRTTEFIVEQRHVQFLNTYKEGRYASEDHIAKLLNDNVDEKAWVMASAQFSRSLAFLSRRKIVGPLSTGDVRMPKHDFYVLEPVEESGRQWLGLIHCQPGPQIGPDIKGKFDPQPFQLYRAVPYWVWKTVYDPQSMTPPWLAGVVRRLFVWTLSEEKPVRQP